MMSFFRGKVDRLSQHADRDFRLSHSNLVVARKALPPLDITAALGLSAEMNISKVC